MRAGGYSVHQTLTTEAANIVKQAISLARRRNHAQVTPLHVATAMLASSNGLLRKACLHSHSHPLQCKALELCFNVALNRLPTTTSSPLLGPPTSHHQHHHPALSNALVAAFKRAQAHQRRGTIENQQQPILALKVELDQLVISMLDDPSVSRVMREAGFSSPQVKSNVEQAVSLDICSQTPSITKESAQFPSLSQFRARNINSPDEQDMRGVIDSLMSKKRKNTVVVGECLDSSEGLIRGVIDKFKRGDVPEGMRGVQFISLPLLSLKNLPMYEAEKKLEEVRCLVRSYGTRGVVLYLGDLKWVSEFWANYGGNSRSYYCPVELMIMEINKLLGDNGKVWVMGIANFKTLMRCKTGQPSLETLWQLQSLTVPVGSLGLSLNLDSELHDQFEKKSPEEAKIGMEKNLNCCADCLVSFNREAQTITGGTCYNESTTTTTTSSSGLPSWLQQYKEENNRKVSNDQEMNNLGELCKKWNSMCSTFHKHPHFLGKALNFASASPSPATSISSHQTLLSWPSIFESPKERQFLVSERTDQPKPELLSNPNSSPNSASSSEADEDLECLHGFKELNSRNLKALCNALEKRVPWQSDIIPDIAKTVLECRSGRIPRKGNSENNQVSSLKDREETWLFFLGVDGEGKENIAKELAKAVFGSLTNFVTMGISSISSLTRADSSELEATSNKRARDESGSTYLDRFAEAVQDNPSRVFFMEDIEQVDCFSQKGIKEAIEYGRIGLPNGDSVSLKDAIVVFSCESFSSMSRASSPPIRRSSMERKGDDSGDKGMSCSLDLNIATEDDSCGDHQDHSVSDVGGILDLVDRKIIFKVQLL